MIAQLYNFVKRKIISRLPKQCVQVPVFVPTLRDELLSGRRTLITGGTKGIGLSIARAFLRCGSEVIITGRSVSRIQDAIDVLSSQKVHGLVLDNKSPNTFHHKMQECASLYGLPDILVNNAGVLVAGAFGITTEQNYDEIMNTNLKGAYFLSQEIANAWIANGIRGNILMLGSSAALRPGDTPYILSKWGIRSLTLGMAKDLIKHGIVVNGIAPGPTATKLFVGEGENGINWMRSPAGRLTTEEEIANLAVILVSGMGRMIIGDMLYVTGGSGVVTVDDIGR